MWSFIYNFISPKRFFHFSWRIIPWLRLGFVLLFSYGLIGGLLFAPPDYQQGDGFRIIYVHVPCAILSLFIYTVMAGAAFTGLVWQLKMAFLVLKESVALGAGFTLLALITGSLWGKPMWNTWWFWDARLTGELILLFLYLGILIFQSATMQKRTQEKALAILVLVGFIDIPIIHYSVYWWNTLHQGSSLNLFSSSTIAASMRYPLIAMIFAFLLYYALILFSRLRVALIQQEAV